MTLVGKNLEKYQGKVLFVNTAKEMGPSDFGVGPKVYENQFKRGQAIKEAVATAYEAQSKETPEVPAVEADSKAVEMDAPEI